jgi:hypothetical protein
MSAEAGPWIAVSPAAALADRPRLFAALGDAFGVRFHAAGTSDRAAAHVVFEDGTGIVRTMRPDPGTGRVLVLCADGQRPVERPRAVTFASCDAIDQRLRDVSLFDRLGGPPLTVEAAEEVLARSGLDVVWTRSGQERTVDRVRSTLPELPPGEALYARLDDRAVAMVAMIELLRGVQGQDTWRPAPLRATIVFDDPNLRRRRYGFIDYERLVRHADVHGYHAAMAMIPLDAGRASGAAVRLFADRPDRLSLVFHGNDHRREELLLAGDPPDALATAAQALRRVARFERRTGLRVDRVMMPPHGRCSETMCHALGAVGFDALCTIHALPWTEDWRSGPILAGWRPADFVAGCPVIPRIPLCCSPADIALRAFLDHPIVLYGHHQDVAGGLDLLAEAAARANRLGEVRWVSPGDVAAANHEVRREGDQLVVRAFSRRIRLAPLAPGTAAVTVVEPPEALGASGLRGWSLPDGEVRAFGDRAPVTPGARPVIRLHGGDVEPSSVPAPRWRAWPRVRRVATEGRDRMLPLRPSRA